MIAVSLSVSPFSTAEPLALRARVSAESRLAARSKLDDVRVDASQKRLTIVRPRSVGHLLDVALQHRQEALGRVEQQLDVGAREVLDADQVPLGHGHASFARTRTTSSTPSHSCDAHADALARRRGQVLADVVGPDGQLAVAAVHEDRELHRRRPPVVEEGVDGGADGASRVEDVVDEDDRGAVDGERQVGVLDDGLRRAGDDAHRAARGDVVAVEGDVEVAGGVLPAADLAEELVDARAEEGAARVDAHDGELLCAGVLLEDLVSDARDGPRHLLGRQDDGLVGGSGFRHKKAPPAPDGVRQRCTPFPSLGTWIKGRGVL